MWIAILRSKDKQHYMRVLIQNCPEKEARRLAERQNLKFAEEFSREPYLLESLEKVRRA